MFDEHLRIIFPAGEIPDGATVTKKTGTKEHTIRRQVVVYQVDKTKHTIDASHGAVFLVDERGGISAVGPKVDLVWFADRSDLYRLLEGEDA